MALGALAALREHGLRVPDDVSVDRVRQLAPGRTPATSSITTVDDRSVEVGAEAARALLARIEQPDAHSPRGSCSSRA